MGTILRIITGIIFQKPGGTLLLLAFFLLFASLPSGRLKAEANQDGSYSYSIPIAMPAGVGGVMPRLSLTYNSRGGNGMLGMGWNLNGLPVITRMNYGRGIQYDANDTYAGPAGRLVDVSGNKTKYHAAKQNWGEYIPSGDCAGSPCAWTLIDNGGNKLYFGHTHDSRIEKAGSIIQDNANYAGVRVWALSKMEDARGNFYTVTYGEDPVNGDYYPLSIKYTQGNGQSNFRTVEFSYEARSDTGSESLSGRTVVLDQRLKWITIRSGSALVRSYRLDYDYGVSTGRSRIIAIQEYGNDSVSTLPALRFSYRDGFTLRNWSMAAHGDGTDGWKLAKNLLGDGRTVYYTKSGSTHYASRLNEDGTATNWTWQGHGSGSDGWKLVDNLLGDGRTVFYTKSGSTHHVSRFNENGTVNNWTFTGHGSGTDGWKIVNNLFGKGRSLYYTKSGTQHHATRLNEDGSVKNWSWTAHGSGDDGWRLANNLLGDGRTIYYTKSGIAHHGSRLNEDGTVQNWTWYAFDTKADGWQLVDNLLGDGRTLFYTRKGSKHYASRFSEDGLAKSWTWDAHGESTEGTRMANNLFGDGRTMYYTRSDTNHYVSRLNENGTVQNYTFQGRADKSEGWLLADNLFGDGRTVFYTKNGSSHIITRLNPDGTVKNWNMSGQSTGPAGWQLAANFSGDGQSIYYTRNGAYHYFTRYSISAPDLMIQVNNGLGGTNDISYTPAAQAPNAISQRNNRYNPNIISAPKSGTDKANSEARFLVTSTTVNDGRGGAYTSTYEYRDGRTRTGTIPERADLGFQSVKKMDSQTGNHTITHYSQFKPYQGMVTSTYGYAGGKLISLTTLSNRSQYACTDSGCTLDTNPETIHPTRVRTDYSIKRSYHDGALLYSVTREHQGYDAYGNPIRTRQFSTDKDGNGNYTFDFSSFINKVAGLRTVGLIYESKSCADEACNTIGKWERKYYDDTALGSMGTRAQVTGKSIWTGNSVWATTHNEFNNYGNLVATTASNGLRTTYTYENVFHRDRASVTTAAGATAYTNTDHRYNIMVYAKDANGLEARTNLDVFGRATEKLKYDAKGGLLAKSSFAIGTGSPAADGVYIGECRYSGTAFDQAHCTYKYSDGMSRVYKVQGPAENGRQETLTEFDAQGRPYRTSKSYKLGETPAYWTTRYFDPAGRLIRIQHPDGVESKVAYMDATPITGAVDVRTITDPGGKKTREHINTAGQVIKRIQALGTEQEAALTYSYDIFGRLAAVTGPTGISVNTTYDAVGRKTSVTDPNTGHTTYTYYNTPGTAAYGKVKTETRSAPNGGGANVIRTNVYDSLARLKSQESSDGSKVTFSYDETTYTYGRGRKTSSEYKTGPYTVQNAFAYDIQGNITATYKTISGPEINTTVIYKNTVDELGRPASMTYPDGSVMKMNYNSMGRLSSQVMNGVTYTAYENYNLEGKVGKTTFANGVVTEFQYEPATGYLTSLKTEKSGQKLLDYQYSFDAVGNVASIQDQMDGGLSMNYQYDNLDRLTKASRGDGNTFAYAFDLAGNLIGKAGLDSAGNVVQRTRSFSGGTHRLMNDGAGNNISYSAAGNMLSKGPWSYAYDDANRLVKVKKSGADVLDIHYEHSGNRFLKTYTKPNGVRHKTYYLGGGYEIREMWAGNTLKQAKSTLYIIGLDGQKTASVTSAQDMNAYNIGNSPRQYLSLAAMSSSASLSGILHKAYYTFLGFITQPNAAGELSFLLTLVAAILLLGIYLFYMPARAKLQRREWNPSHRKWAPVSLLITLCFFGSFACSSQNNDARYARLENIMLILGILNQKLIGDTSMGLPIGTFFYHGNHLGSGSLVTDADGAEKTRINYLPYGEIDHKTSPGDDIITHKFTGQEHDPESGLYYYQSRYYDSTLGVFTSADTIVPEKKSTQAYNRYMYVAGNPIKYTDPTGHSWFKKVFRAVVKLVIAAIAIAVPIIAIAAALYFSYQAWKAGGLRGFVTGFVSGVANAYGLPVSISYSYAGGYGIGAGYGFRSGVGVGVNWTQNGGFSPGVSYGKKVPGMGMTKASVGISWSEQGGYSSDVDVHNQSWDVLTPAGMGAALGSFTVRGMPIKASSQTAGKTTIDGSAPTGRVGRFSVITLADKNKTEIGVIGGFNADPNKGFFTDVMDYVRAAHGNFSGYDDTYQAARAFMKRKPNALVVSHSLGSWTTGNYLSGGHGTFASPIVGMAPPTGTPLNSFSAIVAHRDDLVSYGVGTSFDQLAFKRRLESARRSNRATIGDTRGHNLENLLDTYLNTLP